MTLCEKLVCGVPNQLSTASETVPYTFCGRYIGIKPMRDDSRRFQTDNTFHKNNSSFSSSCIFVLKV
nr:MAG TPA: hypothetical protein [Caudoviricetes sp.]